MSVSKTLENVYLRQRATQLTQRYFRVLLAMSIITYAIDAGLDWLLTLLGDAWMIPEVTAMATAFQQYLNADGITSTTPAVEATTALFTSPKFWCINLLHFIVTGLVSTGITLGGTLQCIEAARGNAPRILGLFSRMRYCLKSWGLSLWLMLKLTLWMIPGFTLVIASAVLQTYDQLILGNWIMISGLVVLFWLAAAALLRYSQAVHILADEPSRGLRESVTFSKELMKGRKWQYVRLCTPAMLKAVGMFLLADIIASWLLWLMALDTNYYAVLAGSLLTSLSMAYFLLQLDMVSALFYLKRRDADFPITAADIDITCPPNKPEVISDKPVSAWLEEHAADNSPAEEAAESTKEEKEPHHEQSDC